MAATVTGCRVALGFVAPTTTTTVFRPASELMLVSVLVCLCVGAVGAPSITAHFAVAAQTQ